MQLPDPEEWSYYYQMIDKPISIAEITVCCLLSCVHMYTNTHSSLCPKAKQQRNGYRSYDIIARDLKLMCNNARTFNDPSAEIYQVFQRVVSFLIYTSMFSSHHGFSVFLFLCQGR